VFTEATFRRLGSLLIVVMLIAASCGDSADDTPSETDTADDSAVDADAPAAATPIPEPTEAPTTIVVPTSTPLPTATPLPTLTPIPLDAPTPSAILLGSAFTNDSKVTTVGIDEVFFGMTADEAAEAASTTWIGESSTTSNCFQVVPENGPEGIILWIVDGFVERIDITHPDLRTPSKLGVGNSLAELEGQLGDRISSEPSPDASGETGGTAEAGRVVATFTPSDEGDRDFRIVFELVEDRVVTYRSGRVGIIDRTDCFSSLEG